MALQQPALFDNRPVRGIVRPAKIMDRRTAYALAAERNARAITRPGTFGSRLWIVRKSGSPTAPFWYVEQAE